MTCQILRFVVLTGVVSLLSESAFAVAPHGVISGMGVDYQSPTNLSIAGGNAWIDGVAVTAGPEAGPVAGQFCYASLSFPTNTPNSAFYVYYITYGGGAYAQYYISTVAPISDGHPSANLVGRAAPPGVNCSTGTTTSAVFVGSFITTAAGTIQPFWRNGDEVLFTWQAGGGYDISFDTTDAPYPVCKAGIGANPLPPFFPASASAWIADVTATSFVGATNTVYLCPENQSTPAVCNVQYPDTFVFPSDATVNGTQAEFKQYIVKASNTLAPTACMKALPAGAQHNGTTLLDLLFHWSGYVEKISHPVP